VPEQLATRLGRRHPKVLAAEATLVRALRAQGRPADALARAEDALEPIDADSQLDASLAQLLCDSGELWLERGELERARERLSSARSKLAALAGAGSVELRAVEALLARARR
jgi:hypothetical protein